MNNTVVSMNIALCAFLLLPVIVTAGLAGVPWVTDRHEVFGVTVPAAAHVNTRIRGFKVAFSGITVALGVCAILVSLAVWQLCGVDAAFWTVSIAAVAIAICCSRCFAAKYYPSKSIRDGRRPVPAVQH